MNLRRYEPKPEKWGKERDDGLGVADRDSRVLAHASVIEDWTRHCKERPEAIRRELWINPFFEPQSPNDVERKFVETRLRRERTQSWVSED